jgi:2-oxoglutarate ferredoxin oxidoreductase subunit beta
MSSTPGTTEPKAPPVNRIGLSAKEYGGPKSTLCVGCGHDVITRQITQAIYEMSIPPHRIAKMSGIGCSSKTTAYFADRGHGFNAVHGRMPAVATGAMMVNSSLVSIGVSGDGDTASIGAGQFVHLLRRNVPMVYIVENNGVYGLTKGQFSATADRGSKSKRGVVNSDEPIDMVMLAMQLGASYVARSFSGDKTQLVPLIRSAVRHQGAAFIDVISPCVAFNNHAGSTKSYDFVREHNAAVNFIDFIAPKDEITADYAPGSLQEVRQHDGSVLRLRKLDAGYDPTDRIAAMNYLQERHADGEVVTGLLYVHEDATDLHAALNTVDGALSTLREAELVPGAGALDRFNASLR